MQLAHLVHKVMVKRIKNPPSPPTFILSNIIAVSNCLSTVTENKIINLLSGIFEQDISSFCNTRHHAVPAIEINKSDIYILTILKGRQCKTNLLYLIYFPTFCVVLTENNSLIFTTLYGCNNNIYLKINMFICLYFIILRFGRRVLLLSQTCLIYFQKYTEFFKSYF